MDIAQEIEESMSPNDNSTEFVESNNLGDTIVRTGIHLPKSETQWKIASLFFQVSLPLHEVSNGLNAACEKLSITIYEYFQRECGIVNKTQYTDEWNAKYCNLSKNQLKTALRNLKKTNEGDRSNEIRFVSKLLRNKISGSMNNHLPIDHDNEIEGNFWKYPKAKMEKASGILPSFSKGTCVEYFQSIFSKSRSQLTFRKANWMPAYEEPKKPFNLQAPSYEELNKIIYRMKTSGAPCPLDQISIITLKRCPYLRTYLLEVIKAAWSAKTTPDEWKSAITILKHKKGL